MRSVTLFPEAVADVIAQKVTAWRQRNIAAECEEEEAIKAQAYFLVTTYIKQLPEDELHGR
ncbi:MAG: hypothetical protein R3C28_11190 [Pirellulaceae bacterium]